MDVGDADLRVGGVQAVDPGALLDGELAVGGADGLQARVLLLQQGAAAGKGLAEGVDQLHGVGLGTGDGGDLDAVGVELGAELAVAGVLRRDLVRGAEDAAVLRDAGEDLGGGPRRRRRRHLGGGEEGGLGSGLRRGCGEGREAQCGSGCGGECGAELVHGGGSPVGSFVRSVLNQRGAGARRLQRSRAHQPSRNHSTPADVQGPEGWDAGSRGMECRRTPPSRSSRGSCAR
ncbi:hypothetical protein EES45_07855 [Streptomyces sp. ADI97-07]|nr:hypothetical protein EES45_07855 [Streptomyces sp. ADI97-07]